MAQNHVLTVAAPVLGAVVPATSAPVFDPVTGLIVDPVTRNPLNPQPVFDGTRGLYVDPSTGVALAAQPVRADAPTPDTSTVEKWAAAASITGAVLGTYHGYKRDNSVGWAIGWAILGSMVPIITIPVSIAQGFGKPAKK